MKIIEIGKPDKIYRIRCRKCNSLLEFTNLDLKGRYYRDLQCAHCNFIMSLTDVELKKLEYKPNENTL